MHQIDTNKCGQSFALLKWSYIAGDITHCSSDNFCNLAKWKWTEGITPRSTQTPKIKVAVFNFDQCGPALPTTFIVKHKLITLSMQHVHEQHGIASTYDKAIIRKAIWLESRGTFNQRYKSILRLSQKMSINLGNICNRFLSF